MKKVRALFSSPKRAVISTILILIIVLAAAGVISAVVIKNSFIGNDEAKKIALKDAEMDESDVSGLRSKLDYDDGIFCYDVDFYSDGTEYEYSIQAKDGDIISRDIDGDVSRKTTAKDLCSENQNLISSSVADSEAYTNSEDAKSTQAEHDSTADYSNISEFISEEDAKSAALIDAGLTEAEVTFTKIKLDTGDFVKVYDVEFYTADSEYDYEINASDGTVKDKSVEILEIMPGENESSTEYIGVYAAKKIAIDHAGLTETEVQISKAKLENDDGVVEYDISFYCEDKEYEYNIDAVSGNIIEFDCESK